MKRYTIRGFKYEEDSPMARLQELEDKIEDGVLVEAVKCKDCKHYDYGICIHDFACNLIRDDDYCCYGERRKEQNDG